MEEPVLWTVLEIEGERPAQPLLLGFSSERRREMYLLLRSLSGIGRKSALLVLDCGETTDILRAAAGDDARFFQQVPGLGKKRIDDLLKNLQKKYKGQLPQALPLPVTEWVEARQALLGTGMTLREAEEALHAQEGESAEELLRGILQ
jgi:Holliday junction resolvasome RuvABC DNA-binding subunit